MSRLTIIVAATSKHGIGQGGRLPWRLPQEMAYFARVTSNAPEEQINAVVMGRNTWESIPTKFRPLPKRLNVVISRSKGFDTASSISADSSTPPLQRCSSLESALSSIAKNEPGAKSLHRAFIIGGASIYKDTLSLPPTSPAFVDRILLTRILSPSFDECDVFMPDFEHQGVGEGHMPWKKSSHDELREWVGFDVPEGTQEEKGVRYEFQMWTR